MSRSLSRPAFSVVELLIIVVVIALLSAAVIPLFLRTLDVSKQKRTMSDVNLVGKAMMSWVTDQVAAAAAGAETVPIRDYGEPLGLAEIETLLVPRYLPTVPEFDAWGGRIEYRLSLVNLSSNRLIAIRSAGSDREFSTDSYSAGAFEPGAFSEDIVWVDGLFVRWPQRE